MNNSKQKIYSACLEVLEKKIANLRESFQSLSEAANNETKSSAGDKHETSRVMMQLEQEKIGKQINEAMALRKELLEIDMNKSNTGICKGSLVKTNKGFLFVGAGLGKVSVDGEMFITVSVQSPLGMKLLGKEKGDVVEMNGTKYHINEVF